MQMAARLINWPLANIGKHSFAAVRDLCLGVHVDERARGCLAKRSADSLPRMGG